MPVWAQEGKILSCSDAVGKAIEWHLCEKREMPKTVSASENTSSVPSKEAVLPFT
jgi:hypothetical protein